MVQKSLGAIYATSDSGTWVCFYATVANSVASFWIGPHDNSFTPGP